ncbi:unnamed protein product [Rotaria magnacalcarata]|uniref:Reverse transcriptase domain-containing protein n=3 Tax=Rotaria magnacalcarata TaxID=392030 RepID=A0A816NXD1_9BILA|nr:unnamed protein product [Rotaria magnacalcarata]
MSKMTKDFRTQAMTVYVQSLGREHELLTNEIKRIIEGFPQENDDGFDAEAGCAAFKQYHELPEKRFNLETDQSIYFLDEQRVEDEDNNQEPNKTNEVELAHLYYLPKAHKPGTPLRPIISGLKHPTIKISKFLDDLLRPLFDQMALNSTVTSSFDLVKQLQQWSRNNFKRKTLFCTIDVTDLYTMVSQIEGVLSLRKMLDELKLKQVVRGGAMGSPPTLTISNCYMYFFERQIVNQIRNSGGLYFRYIDDIFITINWPVRHLLKEVDRWNKFDKNINLSANIGSTVNFLDLNMENQDGQLYTTVFQKPSYEPYYLPFNSIHPLHMKKNIPFAILLRAIRYCSTFESYLNEREKLRMALLLNKYPNKIIDQQFNNVLQKFKIIQP